jgi:NitT/TauT family transport system ATP-binding protein
MAEESMTAETESQATSGAISIRDVEKIYDPEGVHVVAVEHCTFDIKPGEFMVIVGPSGCGKTTLLNMIAGFDNATAGKITLDGRVIASPELTGKRLVPGPDRIVVFQHGAMFPWKTVLENIIMGPMFQKTMTLEEAKKKAIEMMELVGMKGFENEYPRNLSGGMLRRAEIIRALINEPKVLLLDEPFRALDAMTKQLMQEYLLDLYEKTGRKVTMFFITHDLEEAIFLADRVFVMTTRPGKLKKMIEVDLPRPRTYEVLHTERYLELKKDVIHEVHEEARKAFEAGERELAR